jgi:hypothetical protein
LISRKIAVLCLMVPVFHGHKRIRLTSFAKDNSVPGSKQTATYLFSGAEEKSNPASLDAALDCFAAVVSGSAISGPLPRYGRSDLSEFGSGPGP